MRILKLEKILMLKSTQSKDIQEIIEKGLIASAIEGDSADDLKMILESVVTRLKASSIQEYLATKPSEDDAFTVGQHILNASASLKSFDLVNYLLSEKVNPFEINSLESSCFLQASPANREAAAKYLNQIEFLPVDSQELDDTGFWKLLVSQIQSDKEAATAIMGRVTPVLDALIDYSADE